MKLIEKLAREHAQGGNEYSPEVYLTPNTMRDRLLRRELDYLAGFLKGVELARIRLDGFSDGCGCCSTTSAEEELAKLVEEEVAGKEGIEPSPRG